MFRETVVAGRILARIFHFVESAVDARGGAGSHGHPLASATWAPQMGPKRLVLLTPEGVKTAELFSPCQGYKLSPANNGLNLTQHL